MHLNLLSGDSDLSCSSCCVLAVSVCVLQAATSAIHCVCVAGSYFCYDNPGALQDHIEHDMVVDTSKYMSLYAWYSWPNVVLCFFGGFMIDRVFGVRWGGIIFSTFVTAGQVSYNEN